MVPVFGGSPGAGPALRAERLLQRFPGSAPEAPALGRFEFCALQRELGVSEDPNPATIAQSKLLLKPLSRWVLVSPCLQERFH